MDGAYRYRIKFYYSYIKGMKLSIVTKVFFCAAAVALLSACSHGNGVSPDNAGVESDGVIATEPIAFEIKTAERNYHAVETGLDYDFYLTVSADVQWPTRISAYDIKPLQDTLMARLFPSIKAGGIDDAIRSYLKDVNVYQLPGKYEIADSIPAESAYNNMYYATASATIEEVTTDLVTFNISNVQYMGGAHPLSASSPFSYDLKTGNVVSLGNLFEKGNEAEIAEVITDQIAQQLNLTPDEMKQSLLVDSIPVSPVVYISAGQIVFHYNQYEILPYSFGQINVDVSPYQVQDYLTPAACKLLIVD